MPLSHGGKPCEISTYRYMAPSETVGGNIDIRKLELSPVHLSQEDKSMNARIWETFPVDDKEYSLPEGLKPRERKVKGPPYDFPQYMTKVVLMEEAWIRLKIHGLQLICAKVAPNSVAQAHVLARKKEDKVSPLATVIRQVETKKRVVNKSYENKQYKKAITGYMECLFDLMPWLASPLLLTAEQCYDSGLAYLEASLWNNLNLSVLKVSEPTMTTTIKACVLNITSIAVRFMRYAPVNLLCKCFSRLIQLHDNQPWLIWDTAHPYNAEIQKEGLEAMRNKDSTDWAHRHCITEHACFDVSFIEKDKAFEALHANCPDPS